MKKKSSYSSGGASGVVLVLVLILVVILMGIILSMASGPDKVSTENTRAGAGAVQVQEVIREEVESAGSPIGVDVEYSFTVADPLEHDTHLIFNVVHQYVHIYMDEELVYALWPSGETDKITTIGTSWVMFPLYREDSGKDIRVVVTPAYKYARDWSPEFLIGSPLTVYIDQLGKDLPEMIVGALMILAGIAFMVIALYGRIVSRKKGTCMLGLFAVMLGVWYFSDSMFAALLFRRNPVMLHYVSITMLMGCMIPLMKSLKERYCALSQSVLDLCCTVMAFVCLLEFVMQLLGIADLCEMLPVTWGIIGVCGVMVACVMAYERIYFSQKYQGALWRKTTWVLILGAAADLILYFVPFGFKGPNFTMPAFLYFIVARGLDIMYSYTEQEAAFQNLLVEKDRQLMQNRLTTMQSQIRSHFMFNILNAISGMCKYDPQKADQTVVCFARYLRTNIDIMQDDQKVTFRSALRHLEDYVALEQIRFGDQIRFVTQIHVDNFMLPPLVLQPIVENAIKHGLTPKPSGGTVRLRTWAVKDEVWIEIRDDGVGFNTSAISSDRSVGLKNVRFRLENLMHGRMTINSAPGKGTVVTITIPREETDKCM